MNSTKLTTIGNAILKEHGADACLEAYDTTDPEWVARAAIAWGDYNADGTSN